MKTHNNTTYIFMIKQENFSKISLNICFLELLEFPGDAKMS